MQLFVLRCMSTSPETHFREKKENRMRKNKKIKMKEPL